MVALPPSPSITVSRTPESRTGTRGTALFAAAVAVGFGFVNVANPADVLLSPRAKATQPALSTSSGTSPNLVSGNSYGPAAKWEIARGRVAPGSGDDVNLVSGNFAGPAAKDPYARFEEPGSTLLANRGAECTADCAVQCCAKK